MAKKLTPSKINMYTLTRLPSAYFSGVRLKEITKDTATVTVKHNWFNKNPFKSLYWATQGMASELATGVLVIQGIENTEEKISMLVRSQKGTFTKKATGRIRFVCKDGEKVKAAIDAAIKTGEGQSLTLFAEGFDASGESVSHFEYEWGIKLRKKK
ncbi:uncharacterized protein DUF4442 [Kordia periserrulae]|uniref:Uncharacterized protein DUF4442 n=1 Tax=Kordia periserrulae TaxID=701523 RepID=A0A2T6C141_9FLAO|nr:DUF4442 domain-containing protein [Kordia periserrulae]PTX62025.1 uncharacterized protein DUF4442 [Kordia periserrulae]